MDTRRLDASEEGIAEAARLIAAGELAAFPTETVYGLGGDATNDQAVAKIYAAKNRPDFNPLIVHGSGKAMLEAFVTFTSLAEKLAAAFWPGALTLVLKRKPDAPLSLLVSAGLDTVAVRVPDHPLAQALIEKAGRPIAAPSANLSTTISPTSADHVLDSLKGRIAAVLDGGPCAVGIESTVVDLTGERPTLLRPGGLEAERIEEITGPLARPEKDPQAPRSPGMMARHYAPNKPVGLNKTSFLDQEAILGFGPTAPERALNLSPSGDLIEAAANLFAMLRQLDQGNWKAIAVMPIPETGLGLAINDRLKRAATPQS